MKRVLDLFSDPERGRGRDGGEEEIADLERAFEVPFDQRPDALGLQVVRVVIARAERVGAEHDAALDLFAEALATSLRIHVQEIRSAFGPEAVFDAVVPGQVRGGLRGGDDVVRGDGVFGVREGDVDPFRAGVLEFVRGA